MVESGKCRNYDQKSDGMLLSFRHFLQLVGNLLYLTVLYVHYVFRGLFYYVTVLYCRRKAFFSITNARSYGSGKLQPNPRVQYINPRIYGTVRTVQYSKMQCHSQEERPLGFHEVISGYTVI